VKTLSINVWPAKHLEDVMVYEVEIDCGWWTLQQRVHWSDLPAVINEAVETVVANGTPT